MPQPPEFFQNFNEEDAYDFLAKLLFDGFKFDRRMEQAQHGFDVYIPKVVDVFLKVNGPHDSMPGLQANLKQAIYRAFFNAAWQMCDVANYLAGFLANYLAKMANYLAIYIFAASPVPWRRPSVRLSGGP